MAKKLAASYDLSPESRDALENENVQKATLAPNESQALAAVNRVPTTVTTVEQAERISGQLGRINKKLRAARAARTP
jgi:hypothetical protein